MSNEVINPYQTFRDDDGNVLANGTITFYVNTTTALDTIYSNEALTTSQSNPYTLDAFGRIAGDVKFLGKKTLLIKTAAGGHVRTLDNIATSYDGSQAIILKDTLAELTADSTLNQAGGETFSLKERLVGNDGSGIWDSVLTSSTTPNTFNIVISVAIPAISFVLRQNDNNVLAKQWGSVEDGSTDDTSVTDAIITGGKVALFDKTGSQKITTISLNSSIHLRDANMVFDGNNAGFDVDTAIDGLSMNGCDLTGDGVLASGQKGITSDAAITRGYFSNIHLKDLVQGFDLNSAVNTVLIGSMIEGSVGEAAGEGYGVIAGSSQRGVFSSCIYESCQRHGLYLNNALYSTVIGNVFYKHRDALSAGGGLGATQLAGQAKAITVVGNTYSTCTGPEIVISPQPENTSPEECILAVGNAHYNGSSANVRIGGATPSANEIIKGNGVTSNIFQPAQDTSGGVVQVYSGFGINISHNTWYLKDGTGTSPQAIVLGLTTPDDAYFANISICGNNGIFTKGTGNAAFITVCSEICVGTSRVDIFDNYVETDVLIDYATEPTNPNIRTDDTKIKTKTLVNGSADMNIAGYNVFSLTGDAGGSTVANITNGYKGKIIELQFLDANTTISRTDANLAGGVVFVSSNKDRLILKSNGTTWDEIGRSVNN